MGTICVVSLGWLEDDLTLGAVKRLRAASRIMLKTARCGAADWLRAQGIPFATFDALYEAAEDFDELTENVVSSLLAEAEKGDVLYGVNDPGDATCLSLVMRAPDAVELVGGVSEGSALSAFAGGSFVQFSAIDSDNCRLAASQAALIREIDNVILAGELKLRLMDVYPEEWEIVVSLPNGALRRMPLCELDRLEAYDHRVCALVPPVDELTRQERFSFDDLRRVMTRLRAFDGCPWDREQTHESLRRYLIEEAYEVADAIDKGDTDALYDELGDVLLQVAFHAQIAHEYGEFEMDDVTTAICRKMIDRHPHVFGGVHIETADEVDGQWEALKMREKAIESKTAALESVAGSLPALLRAAKVARKAAGFGAPVDDELNARYPALPERFESEEAAGDFLLAAARRVSGGGFDPELALSKAADRLTARFAAMEKRAKSEGCSLERLSHEELILRWQTAKNEIIHNKTGGYDNE